MIRDLNVKKKRRKETELSIFGFVIFTGNILTRLVRGSTRLGSILKKEKLSLKGVEVSIEEI